MADQNRKKTIFIFSAALLVMIVVLLLSVYKTNVYNKTKHSDTFTGRDLFFGEREHKKNVVAKATPRSSTWTKYIGLGDGGSEHNFEAFTYDIAITNNTKDEISDFCFKLVFEQDVFLASAWNGSLEIHQMRDGNEIVETVPDLREFHAKKSILDVVNVDKEDLIHMKKGDYLIYLPSTSVNAMEMPLGPHEGTVPGFIMYVGFGTDISASVLEMEYTFHRVLSSEPLFWIAIAGFACWLVAFSIMTITTAQIRKYNERHERDNEIIRESIETFTGFIDAKDPYTNGHSKRVAEYTQMIAEEMGYEGEELERIYYVALLHDCGKIGVPDNILGKPGRLDDEEFKVIKSHTTRGGEILNSFKSLKNVGEGARYHHERYDGKGYPEGKKGEEIPLIARIICVADSFDAMNSDRVYRKRLTLDKIVEEIESNKGKQFDPEIADILLKILQEDRIDVRK